MAADFSSPESGTSDFEVLFRFQDMVQNILCLWNWAFLFFFFWGGGAVQNGKETEFQQPLAPFWKQGIDKQLCKIWALSSYQFLKSILEEERRT